jgi:hypothetical protein
MQARNKDDRSLGELFGDLARDTGQLLRQEVRLATTEMTHKASVAGRDLALIAVGGLIVYAGFLALVATAILALVDAGLDAWLAALVVGIIVAILGGLLLRRGVSALKRADFAPRETVQTLREDAQWAKEQVT